MFKTLMNFFPIIMKLAISFQFISSDLIAKRFKRKTNLGVKMPEQIVPPGDQGQLIDLVDALSTLLTFAPNPMSTI